MVRSGYRPTDAAQQPTETGYSAAAGFFEGYCLGDPSKREPFEFGQLALAWQLTELDSARLTRF